MSGVAMGLLLVIWAPGIGQPGYLRLGTISLATFAVFVLGMVDDHRGLRPRTKLAVQLVAASFCWWGGVRIDVLSHPFGGQIVLGEALGFAATLAWIVGVTNAINLLDGLDALASGVTVLVSATLILASFLSGEPDVFMILTLGALGGACLGFMANNGHPAKIFMGDSGSLSVGFLLGTVAIVATQKQAAGTALAIPLLALGIPISDTVVAVLRRLLNGHSPFRADADHFHHLLKRLAPGRRTAVFVIYLGTGVLCALALLGTQSDGRYFLTGLFVLGASVTATYLIARARRLLAIRSESTTSGAQMDVIGVANEGGMKR